MEINFIIEKIIALTKFNFLSASNSMGIFEFHVKSNQHFIHVIFFY